MEPTTFFNRAQHVLIEGSSSFNSVAGNQIINNFHGAPERERTEYDEVARGAIYRIKDLGVYTYPRRWDDQDRYTWDEGLRADRTICTAEVIGLQGRVFTVVTYSGPEAREAFEKDFLTFSRALTADPFQVYGLNTSHIPSLLFYNELRPAASFFDDLGFWGRVYLESLRRQLKCGDNELWMDPSRGVLFRGPEGPKCWLPGDFVSLENQNLPFDVELLRDSLYLRFLASCKSEAVDRSVVGVIASNRSQRRTDIEVCQPNILSGFMNKTVAVGGGMWESLRTCVGEREVMDSGQTRFTLKDQGDYLDLRLHQQEAWLAWLVQAPGVFHALRVLLDNDLTDYHLITPEIRLNGYLSRSEDTRQRRQKQPVYLFVCPPSPDTAFESCTTQSLHWWSCHPSGEPSLSEDVCEQLGLPVELSLWVGRFREFSWQSEQYKALHHYQLARGFNPDTLDFARYLGYPIYQVLRGSGRFEEMVEEVPETPANVQSTGKKVSGLWSTVSASISAWSWAASEDLDIPAVGL